MGALCVSVFCASCRPGDTVGIGLDCQRGVVFWTLNGIYGGVLLALGGGDLHTLLGLLGLPQDSGTLDHCSIQSG
jgi:hypothetical protein